MSQILNQIDPTGDIITHQQFKDHYLLDMGKENLVMDLTVTGRKLDTSVIIDHNPDVNVKPWCNQVKVSPFTGDVNDVELWSLLSFFEAQGNFMDLRNLLHVCSCAPPMPGLPLPQTIRKTLFLDLDETLISHVVGKPPDRYHFSMKNIYIIKRPGIDRLLQVATDNGYEIVIFTAGDRGYASPIIDRIDPKGLIANRLYRDSCIKVKEGRRFKDLALTGRSLDKCVIIDDRWSRVRQTDNVIRVRPFTGDMQDSELRRLLSFFKIERESKDLRQARKEEAVQKSTKKSRLHQEESVLFLAEDDHAVYRPKTKETRAAYEAMLSVIQEQLGGQPHDVLIGAADEVLAILKDDHRMNHDKKKEIEKLLYPITNMFFDELVSIGRLITDYQAPSEDAADGDVACLNDEGVAVEFDDDDEDDDGDFDQVQEESEEEDEDMQEDAGIAAGSMQMQGIDNDDIGHLDESMTVNVQDIDAYWLQRKISRAYGNLIDPWNSQHLAEDILKIIAKGDEDQDIERALVALLEFDKFDLVKLLVRNRFEIVWCTRLARAEDQDQRKRIEEEMAATGPPGIAILEQLYATRASAMAWQKSIREEASQLKDENSARGARRDATNRDSDSTWNKGQREFLDLESLSFSQGGSLMSQKKCELPRDSYLKTHKGYDEVFVPRLESKEFQLGEVLVSISDMPEWTHPAFAGMKQLNRVQSRHMKDGVVDNTGYKIVYVAPMKALLAEVVGNLSNRLKSYGVVVKELSGDQNLTREQIDETQIIVTTPEKWDIVTRKSGDRTYTQLVKLMIIDEIHLLHDHVLGPMMGHASRPLKDNSGKKEYYKKYLCEAFPVESHLHIFLHDHMNAEVVVGSVRNKQDAVDYLTWIFMYRGLTKNPNYYNLQGVSHCHLSDHLSELVENVLADLQSSKCVAIEEGMYPKALNLGIIASYYYISYATVERFGSSLTRKTKMKGLLDVLASAFEYADLPIRPGEEEQIRKLIHHQRFSVDNPRLADPHTKANALLQAHFSRQMVVGNLTADQREVLLSAHRLLQAMVDVISSNGLLTLALSAMEVSQMVTQGMWERDPVLLQLLHVSKELAKRCQERGIETVFDFVEMENTDRVELLQMSDAQLIDIVRFCNRYPNINMAYEVVDGEDVGPGDNVTLQVTLERNLEMLEVGPVHAQRFPKPKEEGWWLVVGDTSTDQLLGIKRVSLQRRAKVKLNFVAPSEIGKKNLTVYFMCDSYLGCD
ncbi:hypothetical protein LUZ61_020528 [Rhynchospora tenuis]|uniref:Uncharacterized protein n=1 Tax=Rhynchospora tenuis TaxID=198213 RepID=A0AAD5ZDK8_9POAL|nr:hypothetical protein LUZ61_020528 [Rhynchospora tenuis]